MKKISRKMVKDCERYKEKIEKALRDDIEYVLANNSILSKQGKKTIRVKLKSLIEYELKYDLDEDDAELVGGSEPGNVEGENILEDKDGVEISPEEVIKMLANYLEVIELLEKICGDDASDDGKYIPLGKQKTGALARIHKRATVKQKIARDRVMGKETKFEESDKRFRHIRKIPDQNAVAVVFYVMDTSGSMTDEKKFLARAFYTILGYGLRQMYKSIVEIFICHEVTAKEKTEDEFFRSGESGGTEISSGSLKALEIIKERFSAEKHDIFYWHATDGENLTQDNIKLVEALEKLCKVSRMVCVCEIDPKLQNTISDLPGMEILGKIFPHFILTKIIDRGGIKRALQQCFEKRK